MVDFQQGQQPVSHSSNSVKAKRWSFLFAAGIACLALAGPAQSQLASHQAKAPQIAAKSDATTQPKKHAAPVQADLPAPPPIKYFPGFEEALVATGPVTDAENADLDATLKAFHDAPLKAAKGDDYSDYSKPLLAYIAAHPQSNWNAALYLNLGLGYYHAGYYSRALDAYEKAWQTGKGAKGFQAHLMVDRALGDLAMMHSRLGHEKELNALLTEVVDKRPMGGPGNVRVQTARSVLWIFHHDEGSAYLCGPEALRNMLLTLKVDPKSKQIKIADAARSGPHGFSLTELAKLADKAGFKYRLIKREPGQPVPVPSIINWNVHHYAAITGTTTDGKYVVTDATFGDSAHELSQKAIDAEGSGYFMVPAKMDVIRKNGWHIVDSKSKEAQEAYGMGSTNAGTPGNTMTSSTPCNHCSNDQNSGPLNDMGGLEPATEEGPPMSVAITQAGNVNLHISDTPVGYKPQVGPSAKVGVFYNAQEALQPATFSFGNLSPSWSHGWMAYTYDDPTSATGGLPQRMAAGGGGWQLGGGYNNHGTYCSYTPESPGYPSLARYPCTGAATKYVLMRPDGSQQVYGLFNSATTYPRTIFMTQYIDAQGNATTINYDASFRITSTVDAMGRSTTFTYGLTASPLLITRITDPFGRYTSMTYDTSGRLSTVTDPIGITSTYTYSATQPTFITNLATPYGTSTFNDTVNPNDPVELNQHSLVTTDPMGNSDLTYFYQQAPGIAASDPSATVPSGSPCMATFNSVLQWRDVFYWDKHAFVGNVTLNGSGVPISEDVTKARMYHMVHNNLIGPGGNSNYYSYDMPESVKDPLENRIWYNYSLQTAAYAIGRPDQVATTGRVLDNGASQLHCRAYNGQGQIDKDIDPTGRTTLYNYYANGVDLNNIEQQTGSGPNWTGVVSYGTYNSQHLPSSFENAALQFWFYTYTTLGQIKTVKDPFSHITTYNYDTLNRLSTVVDANSITVLTLTYDSDDRVLTRTDSQGYALTFAYDNIDRVTSITYPDGTTDLYDYTFQSGPLVGTGSLELRKHTDRLGRVTTYAYDADRRLISVTEPTSGTSTRTTQYQYYENGTLKDIIDANGNDTHWAIDIESRPASKTYQYGNANATTETYQYENTTSRVHSITDALGQVKTFTYGLDDRITGITYTSSVNPTPNVTFAFDAWWPRLTSMTDGTGTTSYTYNPNGVNGGQKLNAINGPYTNSTIGLTYDTLNRLSGRTIAGGNETFGYDAISRLNSHGTPLGTFALGYLGETNQLTSQSVTNGANTVSTSWSYDTNINDRRLISITNSGVTRSYTLSYLNGTTQNPYDIQSIADTAATGHPWATQSHSYAYDLIDRLLTASATTPGNSTLAYDNLDNATTFNTPGSSASPTYNGFNQISKWGTNTYAYDANGNLTSGDGAKAYKYDAENRLTEIDYVGSTAKSQFSYDGMGRRTVDTETASGGGTTTTYYLWCGVTICQSRDGAQNVVRRDEPEGEYNVSTGQKLVYIPDQLGSVRDVIDASTGSRVASYDYLPYGALARSIVTNGTDYQFAGLFYHPQSALNLATFRALDGNTGRWINRDPIKERGGLNLYVYADANPVSLSDLAGLYTALLVTLPDGSSYMPMTTVKNKYQAKTFGLPIGTCVAIAVPSEVNPQGDVDRWENAGQRIWKLKMNEFFANYWGDPKQNYKVLDGAIYDAYGNFEYGATGAAAGFSVSYLQVAADVAKLTTQNDPINISDIANGFAATANGGKLGTTQYTPPTDSCVGGCPQ